MQNNNTSISQDLNRIFDLKGENTGEVADFIQPVKEISPRINICRSASAAGAASATIYTTPADKDFYLTAAQLSLIKDAAGTSTASNLNATIDGVSQSLLLIRGITLTAQNDSIAQSWAIPIKIDRNTNITVTNSAVAGVTLTSGTIQGYTQETTKGV